MGEKEPKAAHCTAAPTKTRTLKTSAKLWFGKSACGSVSPIYHLLASQTARVVEWQTRTFEGRMPKGMRVQVPPRAPPFYALTREKCVNTFFKSRIFRHYLPYFLSANCQRRRDRVLRGPQGPQSRLGGRNLLLRR